MEALFDDAVATFGRLDVYFTIAGISPVGTAVTTSYEDYKKVVALDMDSVFLGSKYCIPHMIKTGGGVILNLVGTYGIRPTPNIESLYISTKYQQQFKCVSVGTDCVAAQVSLCRQILCKILRQK